MDASCEAINDLIARYPDLICCRNELNDAAENLKICFANKGKLLICGNGGSAADSEHIVGELMKSFKVRRDVDSAFAEKYQSIFGESVPEWLEGALPAISLVSQSALFTAFSNDESSDGVFAQQVYGYGDPGDTLIAISTSGNSPNVIEAAKVAKAKEVTVIALTGKKPSKLEEVSDICIKVPSEETFEVQEYHLPIYHALCADVENAFFSISYKG